MKTQETQFTPGPWSVHHDSDGRSGTVVCGGSVLDGAERPPNICKISTAFGYPQAQSNAKLIAAAPDLLEALRDISRSLPSSGTWPAQRYQVTLSGKQIDQARAAIARAVGESK